MSAEITPSLDDETSPNHGKIILNGTFSVSNFEGFISSNIGPQMPSFTTSETRFLEALDDRQLMGIWIPGEHVGEETMVDGYLFMGPNPHGKNVGPTKLVKKRSLLFVSASLLK